MGLKELKKEYETQDNRGTAYPFYVQVQELRCVGVMADGYSANCPFGDDEMKTEYRHNEDFELGFDSGEELDEFLCQNNEYTKYEFNEINVGYIWHPVEFFLTIKGAEEYMNANKHNHGKLRTYVAWFERRNYEMRGLLKELGFKSQD